MILSLLLAFFSQSGPFCLSTSVNCPCPGAGTPTGCEWDMNGTAAWMNCIPQNGWQTAYVSNDYIAFFINGLPPGSSCMVVQGTVANASGVTFGDGVRCVGGSMLRLGWSQADQWGTFTFPPIGSVSLSSLGGVPHSGGFRCYQTVFRVAQAFCTPSTFNASNAIGIDWQP